MTEQFIGRAENLTSKILHRLLVPAIIHAQVPIQKLITKDDYEFLDKEIQQHKFDLVAYTEKYTLAIEVNYQHGEKAAKKWNNIFSRDLKNTNITPVTIDDHKCRHLFQLDQNKNHKLIWNDFRDVIDSLELAGVKP